ncbi:MAG TPA: D-alanyl-D-alanine carboxypeptidase family protein [Steroidobacteraceae bacterium]|nr:D-alanyl-D-alanine carboxypeptidase family protein [Steroidobacteraceae bacterium]
MKRSQSAARTLYALLCAASLSHATAMAPHASPGPASAQAAAPGAPDAVAGIPSAPPVDARAYIMVDAASGAVLAEHAADMHMEPASLTKLMTCYLVFNALKTGTLKLNEMVTVSEHAWRAEGSRTFVQVGSQVPAEVLIKGMIVQSGNDATIALAERVGGTEGGFVQLMNENAKRLGMNDTHFDDSSGLPSPTHYMSARDIAKLARALLHDFPDYYPLFSIREFLWNNIRQQNRNGLLERDPSVDGMKTGHTDSAGFCLVSSALRQGMRLITVVLGSGSIRAREDASAALLNYGFTFYQDVTVKQAGTIVLKPRIFKSQEEYVGVAPATKVDIIVPRNVAGSIQTSASVSRPLIAPLTRASVVGSLQIVVSGKPVSTVPLFPVNDVPVGGPWTRLRDTVQLWWQK